MSFFQLLFLFAGFVNLAVAYPSPVWKTQNKAVSRCALASQWARSPLRVTPSNLSIIPAEVAYNCINSVPLNVSAALDLIESIKPYWEWQSTLAYLKDPPAEYVKKVQGPVDVFRELDIIKSKVKKGSFANEYQFGLSLYKLTLSAHDGHFLYIPDSVGKVFSFARELSLVSVSMDGKSPPRPYLYRDIQETLNGSTFFKPSPILKIDGEPATTWLERWSQYNALQDRDALYNEVFFELAAYSSSKGDSGTFVGGGLGTYIYPGAKTTLQLENGTSVVCDNYAIVLANNFTGIQSGEALYKREFEINDDRLKDLDNAAIQELKATARTTSDFRPSGSASISAVSKPDPGYPAPVERQEEFNHLISGYFLSGANYADIAVLSVPSFPTGPLRIRKGFQKTSQRFLAKAFAAGKTKLVIDLSANGGGAILNGYDLFKQLFPSIDAFAAADRMRAIESINLLGQSFSEAPARILDGEDLGSEESFITSGILNYQTDETPRGHPFASWAEKFGAHNYRGDNFTSLLRWNLTEQSLCREGFQIQGYGGYRMNFTQPFAAKNIIIMTDGSCASTCTIFSRLMTDLAGVKLVAMGGRSRSGIIQAVGGTKGTKHLTSWAYKIANETQMAFYNTTPLATLKKSTPLLRATRLDEPRINFRDAIKINDFAKQTPLQFVYEPADCRIYWTPNMTVDITAAWKAVADSA